MARILVVDDVSDIRVLVRQFLFEAGHDVLTAQDATEAQELLNQYNIDLLILDIDMPYINGIRFSESLRSSEQHKHIPFIFLTVQNERKSVSRAVNVRPEHYILKPADKNSLLNAVSSVLKRLKIRSDDPAKIKNLDLESRSIAIRKNPLHIISLSETGFVTRTDRPFSTDETIHLETDFFKKVGIPNLLLKIGAQRKIDNGKWEVALLFKNPQPIHIVKIRHWLSLNQKNA